MINFLGTFLVRCLFNVGARVVSDGISKGKYFIAFQLDGRLYNFTMEEVFPKEHLPDELMHNDVLKMFHQN